MSIVAVIPARQGSKGIPNKNLKEVGGLSLIQRSVRTCLLSGIFSQVIVSTDSQEIADQAKSAGADVVERPKEISGDFASSEDAVIHALTSAGLSSGYVCMLQCTSPFTTADDLQGAWEVAKSSGSDCLLAATQSHAFLWEEDNKGWVQAINHDQSVRLQRQGLPETFRETGAFYFMKMAGFMQHKHRFFGNIKVFPVPQERSVDIDTPLDLSIAKILADRK